MTNKEMDDLEKQLNLKDFDELKRFVEKLKRDIENIRWEMKENKKHDI